MTPNLRAEVQHLIAKWRARADALRPKRYVGADDAANACEQCADDLESLLSALIAEGPSQQDDGVEQRADEAFRELATYKEDAEDTEAAPRSAQATAESEKAK